MATEAVEASNRTIARAAANAAEQHGGRVAVRFQRDGEWRELTFAEVAEIVDEIALGLVGLGIEPGDRVALLANTRPEWTFSSLAISRAGAVVVPIYPDELPGGVRMGRRQLRLPDRYLRGRGPGGQDRQGQKRAARPRAHHPYRPRS